MPEPTAIVGVADHVPRRDEEKPIRYWELARKVSVDALDDAGLKSSDVDGVIFTRSGYPLGEPDFTTNFCERMGIRPAWMENMPHGGTQLGSVVWRAALAIGAGLARTVLVVSTDTRQSRLTRGGVVQSIAAHNMDATYEYPHGPIFPSTFALMAHRHMHEFGTTSEQLASVAVSARRWAALHPNATMRDELTVEDVLASRMISSPLHLLEISLVTNGGGAIVVTDGKHAREVSSRPVSIRGYGDCAESQYVTKLRDLARCDILARAARTAYDMAGIGPDDIDIAYPYDPATIHVIWVLEQLGIVPLGGGGPFVEAGHTSPGGRLPCNTHGGLMSYSHPGVGGTLLAVIEAVRQIRGGCGERQVDDARVALITAMGAFMAVGVNILAGDW
jgi:acetyl-CoA acetyltransferase